MSTECASSSSSSATSTGATTGNERKMPLSRSLTQPQGTIEYMVTTTDSLNSVAARFQTTPSELARMNKITGRYIFSGQILYVPKRGQDGGEGVGGGGGGAGSLVSVSSEVPPNTPNETSRTPSNGGAEAVDQLSSSALPGHAQRVTTTEQVLFPANHHHHHHQHHPPYHQQLQQTVSSPISTMKSLDMGLAPELTGVAAAALPETTGPLPKTAAAAASQVVQAIDPADRECLERFLKIAVRHITDGQGVVSGVLLVTPNALMFDPNVSDPLVIEHGTELYSVTVPMELVLKTALYTDIAHMRVKHAPEAVPSVPKPAVYYGGSGGGAGGGAGSGEDGSIIAEENLRSVYASKTISGGGLPAVVAQFDTISSGGTEGEEVATEVKEDQGAEKRSPSSSAEKMDVSQEEKPLIDLGGEEPVKEEEAKPVKTETMDQEVEEEEELPQTRATRMEAEVSIDLTEEGADGTTTTTTNSVSFDGNGSFEQNQSCSDPLSSSPQLNNQQPSNNSRLSSYFQTKLALSERHSAPISDQGISQRSTPPPPLVTAVSADGEGVAANSDDSLGPNGTNNNINKRRSAHGESRREQMLKRLSNPVDTLGNITKSGINSSINATKTGFNATKSGLGAGFSATKSGLNATIGVTKTGLNATIGVTKTGFNKVLSTPKNLMDLSSSLVRDAKGALGTPPGSKSDTDLSGRGSASSVEEASAGLSYTNMVDTKVDAFENFDKLMPRPAKHSKDPPLYLCIRMGKRKKVLGRQQQQGGSLRGQRFSPTYSFGRKKYEREYWFSVPKEKSKNLYHFFQKWAPEVYGDVDTLTGCEARGLEPINTDDELEGEGEEEEEAEEEVNEVEGGEGKKKKDGEDKENDAQKLNVVNSKSKFWRRRSPLNFLKLVEDHFSTEGMSTDWNISNSSEEHSFAERFGLEPSEPILPDINGQTELLTADIIRNLSKHLPARAEGYGWSLIYSTAIHGFSLNTLYREMKRFDSPVLLIIEDTNGAIFGALLSNSLQLSDHFYGTGETFLFTFHPDFACYPWTGENLFFIKGNADSVSIGAGEGNFGLWLDGDLYHGSSHPCKTFGNVSLSSEEDFVVKSIECWGFV